MEREIYTIGTQLKNIRKQSGLTQSQLAEQLYVSTDMIRRYENGYSQIGNDHLISLCRIFDVSADYFLFGTVYVSEEMDDTMREIYHFYMNKSQQERKWALEVMRVMFEKPRLS
ncbi:MAG: helix-turn-helix transcriptional regulator [Eubacteriales bacterium]